MSDNELVKIEENVEKHEISLSLKEKFDKLKERRIKISEKVKRKEVKRLEKKCANAEEKCSSTSKNTVFNIEICKKNLNELKQYMIDYDTKILNDWPLKRELDQIEVSLNKAIKEKNYDLAEELNNKLCEKNSELRIKYAVDAQNYLKEKAKTEKPLIKWTFEAKKRWESKANM